MSVQSAHQRRGSAAGVADSILALYLATAMGWAQRSANGQILSGTVSFKPSRYDGGGIR